MEVIGKYFYGNEISSYGQEHNYVDYGTLAKAVNHVMANDLMEKINGFWEIISGELGDEEGNSTEIFQWYITDAQGAEILEEANEIVFYNEELELYLWGVTHWGTSWDYVLTDIKCNAGYGN